MEQEAVEEERAVQGEGRQEKEGAALEEESVCGVVLRELEGQRARIELIIAQLVQQNELLAVFQRDALMKLGENAKLALREQLTEASKETLRDLRDIKNTSEKVVNLLVSHQRRIARIEDALQRIRQALQ